MKVNKQDNWFGRNAESMRKVMMLLLAAQALPLYACAATLSPANGPKSSQGSATVQNLDLSSITGSVAASKSGSILLGGQISGNGKVSGGTKLNVTAGQLLTPAMNAALMQSSSGPQHLLLNNAGAAIGGINYVTTALASSVSSLVVPKGVTVDTVGFQSAHPLNVAGPSTILGSVFALQTSPGLTALLNFGGDLNIGAGGVLSGAMLQNQDMSGLYVSKNLTANVAGNFTNNGVVSAPYALNLNVAGTLTNATVAGAPQATLLGRDVNIVSGNGVVINSGLIQAANTVYITTMNQTVNLLVSNQGGSIQATGETNPLTGQFQNGVINFREDGPNAAMVDVSVQGGYLYAPGGVNVYGRNINFSVDTIVGPLTQISP